MYSLLKIAVSRILAKIIAKSFCPCSPLPPVLAKYQRILLTTHVESVSLEDIQGREPLPLSYLHTLFKGFQCGALAVDAEEGLPVVHDTVVIVLNPVTVDLALVPLIEIIAH